MSKYKIAFFDIDGTLINSETKKMTEQTRNTLLKLKENGVILCIATGRPLMSVPKFEDGLFDAYLTFNGSYCIAGDEVIYKQPIEHGDVLKIIDNAKRINRPAVIASAERMGANGTDKDLDDYFALAGQRVKIIDDFDELAEEDIYQIMMGAFKEEYDAILHDVDSAKITAWWYKAIDIIPAGGGKGEAVKRILKYYDLDVCEAIAFGDGENDIEMLQTVRTGVAMGNANAAVKSKADDVCKTVAEDGIYHYCTLHNLI